MKFKCKMCGAPLDVKEGQTVVTCEFCQSKQTVANANDDRKENLFNRANSLRSACDFDKAILSYQSILTLFPNEPEAYWGICLCKYGVEYIDDTKTGKKIPTIHRASFNSILKDNDYLSAISYADVVAKEEYEEEAKQIANIQKNYLSISQKEEPFDIFICYKESDEKGKRTPDSVMAQEIYSNLTDKGYKVFFARITLENKLGSMYEPYIFAALNSAKIMIVIGTKKEYFEATWVKNEWSRYIDLMRTKPDSYLIPCYKDMDAYEMPDEFLSLQAQDLSKLGFMQDLIRGIDKIMGKEEINNKHVESTIIQTDVNISALLKRAEILIGDDDFEKADNLLERVLDNDPVNSQAYLLKLLISFNFHSIEELKNLDKPLETNNDYKKAYEFGDKNQKKLLENINEYIKNKIEAKKNDEIYNEAIDLFENEEYNEAFDKFNSISNYKDSNKKAEECIEKIYLEALDFKKENEFETAIKIFNGIINYKDSRKQIEECKKLKADDDNERIYKQCVLKKEINSSLELNTMVAACKKLQAISGYKDADNLLVCYESLINDFREKQNKIKEEKIRIRKQKLKKIRKISIIFSSVACVVTFILLLTFLYLIPQNRQDNIQKLIDNRDYESALSLIEENNGYGDSNKLEKMCLAGKSFEDLDYDSGINYIYDIGGTVDVEFDSNGGISEKQTQTIKKSKSLIENETTKDGYNFYGWKQENYSIDSKSHYAKVLLKAQYNVITYQIKYTLDGGTCEEELPKIYNTEQEIVLPNLTKTGYNFLGWSTFKDVEPQKDYVIKKGTVGNLSIVANWEAKKFIVNLDYNDDVTINSTLIATYNTRFVLPTPTRFGYEFKGWYDSYNTKYETCLFKYTNDLYLHALWNAIDYKIIYNLDGGVNNSNPSVYTIESSFLLKEPTKKGYTFIGWTTKNQITPTKIINVNKGTTGDLTFTANWVANKYNVTIDTDGGKISQNKYTFTYDSNYYISNPTKEGYTFSKFIYDDNLECSSSGVWKIDKDVTLKAIYTANTNTRYTVNYYLENLDGNGYSKKESEIRYGTSDTNVTVYCKTYDGFSKQNVSKLAYIKPNGTTSVDFYYTRNSYTLSFVCNGGDAIENKTLKYEEEIPNNIKPIRKGYTFENWYANIEQTELLKTMPAHNTNLYAYYSEETKVSHFDYSLNNTSAIITKGKNLSNEVVVPEFINNLPVTKIDDNAFLNCEGITKITLPVSIEELGSSCFKGCTSLIEIKGTSNLSIIKDSTFEGCRNLSIFPDLSNVTAIGNNAFKDCASLTTIDISDSLTSIGSNAFKNCLLLLKTPDLSNVNMIGDNAFEGCLLLTDIEALDVSSSLGENVLKACKNIAKITMSFKDDIEEFYVSSLFGKKDEQYNNEDFYIVTLLDDTQYVAPNSLKQIEFDTNGKIPDYLCYGLTSITKVTDISVSTTNIGKHAFDGCTNLIDFITQNSTISLIDEYAFQNCTSLTTMPEFHLEEVKKYAFANCNSLLVAPSLEDVNYIGDYAFSECSLIKSIKAPNATYMGLNSLYGCTSLNELEVPFVGTSIKSSEAFGVIFGTTSYDNSYAVTQLSKTYYVPNGLIRLTIGGISIKEKTCVNLTSVTTLIISDSVELIGQGAFNGFNSLESITLPFVGDRRDSGNKFGYIFGEISSSLKKVCINDDASIPSHAFDGCTMLENITISNNVDYIGSYAFSNCSNLSKLNSDEAGVFNIPQGVKTINTYTFCNCSLVEEITLSDGITLISDYAFAGCSLVSKFNSNNFAEIVIPTSCGSIGEYAFKGMALTTNLIVSDSVESIGVGAFNGFNSLESITLPFVGGSDDEANYKSVFGYIFGYTTYGHGSGTHFNSPTYDYVNEQIGSIDGLTWQYTCNTYRYSPDSFYYYYYKSSYYYYIPASLRNVTITIDTTLPVAAFNNCTFLENIHLPNCVDSIGDYAFQNCASLKRLNSDTDGVFNIPASVTVIPDYSFYNCSLAENIILSENVTSINQYAFANCSSVSKFNSNDISKMNIPDSCIQIGDYAFKGMALLTNVVVSDSVESIGQDAFNGFNSLESITLPFVGDRRDSGNKFGYIFGEISSSLKKVCINDDASIPSHAFDGCTMLENITISNNVDYIGSYAFSNCSNLSKLNSDEAGVFNIPQGVKTINTYTFCNCSLVEEITLSDGITLISDYAFAGCSLVSKFNSNNFAEIVIPTSCGSIGEYAFKGMALTTNLIVSDSVESIGVGAFNGFNSLESITLPFVGGSDDEANYKSVFGYIFGYTTYGHGSGTHFNSPTYDYVNEQIGSIDGLTWQYTCNTYRYSPDSFYYYYYKSSYYYYIPASLRNVTITIDTTLPVAAFNNCTFLENIHLPNCVDSIGDYAFQNCNAIVDYLISPSKSSAWDGSLVATTYHGGSGTLSDPYQIFSAKEFVYFLNQINNGETYDGVYFVLTSNINLGGFAINSTSLTEKTIFKGTLDGNSHKVFNFSINTTDNTYNGLFGYMDGTIKNIGFETSMTITTSKTTDVYVGLIIGNLSGTLENVYVSGALTSTSLRSSYVGGMVGYSTGTILNSYSSVTINSTSTNLKCYAAGLVGYNDGTITGSFAYGNVSAKGYAETYSYASGLVAAEGTNSIVTSCFRYSGQAITKFGSSSTSYNKIGTVASLEDIISYCKVNWNDNVWSYKKMLPSF